jgi:hypothetical protein
MGPISVQQFPGLMMTQGFFREVYRNSAKKGAALSNRAERWPRVICHVPTVRVLCPFLPDFLFEVFYLAGRYVSPIPGVMGWVEKVKRGGEKKDGCPVLSADDRLQRGPGLI